MVVIGDDPEDPGREELQEEEPPVEAEGGRLLAVDVKAQFGPPSPSGARPASARRLQGWRAGKRSSILDKIARATTTPVNSTSTPEALLAHVLPSEDALVCYRPGSRLSRTTAPAAGEHDLEVALRIPLCLATAAECGSATIRITVATPTPELKQKLRNISSSDCEVFSAPKEQRDGATEQPWCWELECESPEDARLLLDSLQLAGCRRQGLHLRYRMLDTISAGHFGLLFRAEDRQTGEQVAVKLFTGDHGSEDHMMHPLMEAHILRKHSHANIQQFRGIFEVSERQILEKLGIKEGGVTYAMVTEFLAGGELFAHVKTFGQVSEDRARHMMRQLLSAVRRLHEDGIVHRNIKLESLILTGSGDDLKLIDFGLSASEKDAMAMSTKAGSAGYLAPEVMRESSSCKVDCFSSGVVMYTLLTGKTPFPGNSRPEMLQRNLLCDINIGPLAGVSTEAKEVVMGLLCRGPRERLSAVEALQHPWFAEQPPAPPPTAILPKPSAEPDIVSGRDARAQTDPLLLQLPCAAAPAPMDVPCSSGVSAVRALQSACAAPPSPPSTPPGTLAVGVDAATAAPAPVALSPGSAPPTQKTLSGPAQGHSHYHVHLPVQPRPGRSRRLVSSTRGVRRRPAADWASLAPASACV